MPRVKLDSAFCAAAECQSGKKKTDYWDKDGSGFVLETRATGGKTYYLRYIEANGRQRQLKIGRWQDITFAAAKKIFLEAFASDDPAKGGCPALPGP